MQIINEVMDKKVLGSASNRLPDTPAKHRLALIAAAKAVVIALTPGMPTLQRLTIQPRGDAIARTLFMPQVAPKPRCPIWLGIHYIPLLPAIPPVTWDLYAGFRSDSLIGL